MASDAAVEALLKMTPSFWSRVAIGKGDQCWPWCGPVLERGYGRWDSPAGQVASRFAWATKSGRLPKQDEVVRHVCDNPPCCNPRHLVIGSQYDNVMDMAQRGGAGWSLTHCAAGHEFTPENTRVRKNGHRRCLACSEIYAARRVRPRMTCPHCGVEMGKDNIKRHLRRLEMQP